MCITWFNFDTSPWLVGSIAPLLGSSLGPQAPQDVLRAVAAEAHVQHMPAANPPARLRETSWADHPRSA